MRFAMLSLGRDAHGPLARRPEWVGAPTAQRKEALDVPADRRTAGWTALVAAAAPAARNSAPTPVVAAAAPAAAGAGPAGVAATVMGREPDIDDTRRGPRWIRLRRCPQPGHRIRHRLHHHDRHRCRDRSD